MLDSQQQRIQGILAKVPASGLERRIGGRLMRLCTEQMDPAYPHMQRWAQAGVRGGIPQDYQPMTLIEAGADGAEIQEALNRVAEAGGGTVLLAPGTYLVDQPLRLPSRVLLRGTWPDQVWIEGRMRAPFAGWNEDGSEKVERPGIIEMRQAQGAGVASLTLVYDRSLPPPLHPRRGAPVFQDSYEGECFVLGIRMIACSDCWVEACNIYDSGSNPVDISTSQHCTLRSCSIHGSHLLGGGQGYVHIFRSRACLLSDLCVSDIRHLTIQSSSPEHPCTDNVVIGCDLRVDVNFHSGDSGGNLIEGNRIHIPPHHWWGPFAAGVRGQHQAPGPGNLIWNCEAVRWKLPGVARSRPVDEPIVYAIHPGWESPLVRPFASAPLHGTLYAMIAEKDDTSCSQ